MLVMLPATLQDIPYHEQILCESNCDRFHHPLLSIAFASDGGSNGAGAGAGVAPNSNTIPIIITIP